MSSGAAPPTSCTGGRSVPDDLDGLRRDDHADAIPGPSILQRFATFWLSIVPSWSTCTWLQRNDHL